MNISLALLRSDHHPIRLAYLFGFASITAWVPLFSLWLDQSALPGRYIGVVAAIPWLIMLFFQPIWGFLADRYGKIICLRISLAFSIFVLAVFPLLAHGTNSIILSTILLSLFNTPVLSTLDSMALDYSENLPGLSYSNLRFWGAPGTFIGAMFAGWLIPHFGVDSAFYAASFFYLIVFALLFIIKLSTRESKMDLQIRDFCKLISNRRLISFLIIILIVSIGQASISFYFPIYMDRIGASSQTIGLALGIQSISELPFFFIATWLLKRIKANWVVVLAIIATALRMFLYSINDNPNSVLLIESLNGITWTLLWIASVEFVDEMVPSHWRATGQALLWVSYSGAGAVLGNIIIGNLYQDLAMQQVYLIGSMCMILLVFFSTGLFLMNRNYAVKI